MKLGAHLSIAGGIFQAVESAKEIGANTLQIFSSPPRNWKKPKAERLEIEKFRNLVERYNISPVFIHAKYLVNLGSDNRDIQEKSIKSLIADLSLAYKIGALGVIFHPHSKNLQPLIENIKRVLQTTPPSTYLILENSAQERLETIGEIIKTVKSPRLKFCLDLAHAFQAGYNLATPKGLKELLAMVKEEIGYRNLLLIHANDSKTDLGSKIDRHENIGEGKLGPVPFFVFLNHPATSSLPFIIETPGFREKGLVADKKNLKRLKTLVGRRLGRDFFLNSTLEVAKNLLGKYLVVKRGGKFQVGEIIETEAYVGKEDKASHASRGKTERNKIMWEEGGKLYVYLIYGVHFCLNVVTEKKGYPSAVLIRGLKPIFGIQEKVDGPGKICRSLGITKKDNGLDITKSGEIYIKDVGIKPKKIISTSRIGIDYAGEWKDKKWRFLIKT